MSRTDAPVSLADLAAAGIRLRPFEAVTIVRELALQVARDLAPGVPSAHVIRLAPSGAVFIEGPVAAGGRSVARAAQLLDTLLPGFDAPPEFRAPGALRLVIARALGTVDLPPYATLNAFAEALTRFAAPEAAAVVRQLVSSWAESVAAEQPDGLSADEIPGALTEDELSRTERVLESFAPAVAPVDTELTISDVRRARRATGLTLGQIGERSRIPVSLLRELEWGYLRHWPTGHYGRTQLIRYARAAGLDEQVVVNAVWPMLDEQPRADELVPAPVIADVQPVPDLSEYSNVTWLTPARPAVSNRPRPSRRTRVLAALAIPALIALAVAPALWYRAAPKVTRAQPSALTSRTDSPASPAESRTVSPRATPEGASSEADRLVPAANLTGMEPATRQVVTDAHRAQGLTTSEVSYSPAFSSVGSAMFYHTDANGPSALMRADTDSGGAVLRITRIVDDSASNFHVRPSPDGTRIAFDSDRDGERAVYVADANGRHVRRVSADGFAAVPSWSPDGQTLAFVRAEPEHPKVWNLWTTDLTTGTFRRLTNHRVGQPWGGSWFPDGKRMAYSLEDRLVILDLETGAERVFPSPKPGRLLRTPAVSPDGNRVIFQVRRDGGWLLELKDGSMRKVLSDPTAEEYTWSPDGRRVAYHSGRTGTWGVWVMALR